LRLAKRRAALVIAIADIGGMAPLPWITGALSQLAEVACGVAVRHLLHGLHEAGQISLGDPGEPERQSGFVVLALGKLGGAELNYSSDIDLVLLYDPQNPAYPPEAQPIFAPGADLGAGGVLQGAANCRGSGAGAKVFGRDQTVYLAQASGFRGGRGYSRYEAADRFRA
jgi:hypothetical protein